MSEPRTQRGLIDGKHADTLVELLRKRAATTPDATAYAFLDSKCRETNRLTYAELDLRARAIAAHLQERFAAGDRVLLVCPGGADFVTSFFGALYAGVIAVPLASLQSPRDFEKAKAIAANAGTDAILSTRSIVEAAASTPGFRWLALEDIGDAEAAAWKDPAATAESLAFLQYTSGSTGLPKGVMVSHGNLLHNLAMMADAFEHEPGTVIVGWLPLFHDMGLIGNMLQAVFMGVMGVLIPPMAFLRRPVVWLEAITRYRGSFAGGPNFAYDVCVRRISEADRAGLDLSSWKVAFNGAEPIRSAVLDAFITTYAPHGFRRETFYPCYGLAEATLFVSGGACSAPAKVARVDRAALEDGRVIAGAESRALVACGHAWHDQRIAIVAPDTKRPCGPDEVGEIWVSGPSMAHGYWGHDALSEATFRARLEGLDGVFLRTGDLGFLRDGELFITGRIKDLIIVRGRNHNPEDLEHTAELGCAVLRRGCSAAFSCDGETGEELVMVHEVAREQEGTLALAEVEADIREAIADAHNIRVHTIRLVPSGTVPKTSSGKVQRHQCRKMFLTGKLPALGTAALELT